MESIWSRWLSKVKIEANDMGQKLTSHEMISWEIEDWATYVAKWKETLSLKWSRMNTKTRPKSLSLHMPWAGFHFTFKRESAQLACCIGVQSAKKSHYSVIAQGLGSLWWNFERMMQDSRLKYSDGHLMKWSTSGVELVNLKPKITLAKCAANHAQDTCASEALGGSPYCHTPRVARILTIRKEVDISCQCEGIGTRLQPNCPFFFNVFFTESLQSSLNLVFVCCFKMLFWSFQWEKEQLPSQPLGNSEEANW